MRRQLQSALLLLGLSSLATAIFKDEAGHIDFHYSLVGIPQVDTTFFHRPRKDDKASLLYTLSDVGVVGAVNPSNGQVVWRQKVADGVAENNGRGHLRAPEGEDWVAAAHGQRVQAWNALTGRNVWQMDFGGEIKDLEIMELTESSRKDVLVLSHEDGVTVLRRLHGGLGSVVWEFRTTTKDVPLQVATNVASIYVVSLHGSLTSYTLRVTALDTATGGRTDEWSIGTKGEVHKPEDVMFVGSNSVAPFLAWTNSAKTKLSISILGTKTKQEFPLPPDTVDVQIHAPHLAQSQPHFLVHIRSEKGNRGQIFHTDLKTNQIRSAFELAYLPGKGAFSTSSEGANVYFTRVHDDEVSVMSSETNSILAYWRLKPEENVSPVQTVSEVVRKADGESFAVRSAVLTEEEDWIMIKNGEKDWTRPEGLSASVAAVWAEIPEVESLAKVLEQEAHTNPVSAYISRVTRHIDDLRYLPEYLTSLPASIMSSIFGGDATTSGESMRRDTYGFHKVIVVGTKRGRFYGLDSGDNGKIAWSKTYFPQPAGESLDVRGILADNVKGTVEVRGSKGEHLILKTDTGEIIRGNEATTESPVIASTAIIAGESRDWLLGFDAQGKPAETVGAGQGPNSTVVVLEGDKILKGIKFTDDGAVSVAKDVWQLQVFAGQKIAHVASMPSHNPVASIGRVLGDRRVEYKYLNPNTMVVSVVEKATSGLSIQLVDTVSGQVLASQHYEGVDTDKTVSCTMAENWYACSFFGDYILNGGSSESIKGYQVVVTDLYESPDPNDRGPLGETANFSSLAPVDSYAGVPLPWVVSQSWVISQPLEKLTVTQTRQGVTNKQILAYMPETHAVVGLPRLMLDPKRPVGRDPTAAEMEAEGLPRYAPGIEISPQTVISHEWDVLGIEGIVATAATVESTTLVVAYGVDLFGTRVSPSGMFDILGKGFDKLTLVGTVVALFGGVLFLAPMVLRKQINMRWEAPM